MPGYSHCTQTGWLWLADDAEDLCCTLIALYECTTSLLSYELRCGGGGGAGVDVYMHSDDI